MIWRKEKTQERERVKMDFLYGARKPTLPYHVLSVGQGENAFPKAIEDAVEGSTVLSAGSCPR